MTVHAILNEADQLAIVNALKFYNDFHATDWLNDPIAKELWQLAFQKDNSDLSANGTVDQLATRISNLN